MLSWTDILPLAVKTAATQTRTCLSRLRCA